MRRNIKTLFNFEPPASEDEIRAASLQFVRKLSGFNAPSKANQAAVERAVEQVTAAAAELIGSLVTHAAATATWKPSVPAPAMRNASRGSACPRPQCGTLRAGRIAVCRTIDSR